jgi:hypothetical protein
MSGEHGIADTFSYAISDARSMAHMYRW